jgi:hypothetical protein
MDYYEYPDPEEIGPAGPYYLGPPPPMAEETDVTSMEPTWLEVRCLLYALFIDKGSLSPVSIKSKL